MAPVPIVRAPIDPALIDDTGASDGDVITRVAGVPAWEAPGGSSTPTAHGIIVYHNTTQSMPETESDPNSVIQFNTEEWDCGASHGHGSLHSTSSNTGRITIPSGSGLAGLWRGTASIFVPGVGTNQHSINMRKNGASLDPAERDVTGASSLSKTFRCVRTLVLAEGDYADFWFNVGGGGAAVTIGNAGTSSARNYCYWEFLGSA